ncbi:hypothetical protein YC2023_044810 [Brassica napus]
MGEKSKEIELSPLMNTRDQIQNSRLHSAECPNKSEIQFEVRNLLRCRGASFRQSISSPRVGRGGREAGGGCSRFLGVFCEIDFLLRSRTRSRSVRRRKGGSSSDMWWFAASGLGGGWFSSVRRFGLLLSLVEVCAGGSHYHGGEFVIWSTQADWCSRSLADSYRYCQRFKRWSSMLLQWPLARLPHLRFFTTRSLLCGLGCCSTNFSLSVLGNYVRLVVLVSLAASLNARSSITSLSMKMIFFTGFLLKLISSIIFSIERRVDLEFTLTLPWNITFSVIVSNIHGVVMLPHM